MGVGSTVSEHHRRLSRPRWDHVRRLALDAAGWRCTQCGRAGRLEVHHVVPLDDGGAAYDLDNLVVLCRGCHIAAHRRPLTEAEQAWADAVAAFDAP